MLRAKNSPHNIPEIVVRYLDGFGGRVLVAERGHQLRDNENRAIEHFGYADGVSQPQFIDDGSEPRRTEFSQLTPLRRVLDQDRLVDGEFGSFLVYRKLEQNVKSFNAAVQNVANQTSGDPVLAGAQAVGRFKNGTPITTHPAPKPGYNPNNDEDFNYDKDKGGRCPLHAHIRKTNPRDSLGFIVAFLANEEIRRIARRGITYGERPDLDGVGGVPSGGVGLIFLCYQNDIKDQFEFMQKEWANDPSFPNIFRGRSGIDPVIGQDKGRERDSDDPHWPTRWNAFGGERKRVKFGEHVTLLGGEYFFAPSMAGLRKLGTP